MLLLEFPQLGVDVKRASEVGLPLLVSVLRQVSAAKDTHAFSSSSRHLSHTRHTSKVKSQVMQTAEFYHLCVNISFDSLSVRLFFYDKLISVEVPPPGEGSQTVAFFSPNRSQLPQRAVDPHIKKLRRVNV